MFDNLSHGSNLDRFFVVNKLKHIYMAAFFNQNTVFAFMGEKIILTEEDRLFVIITIILIVFTEISII